MILTEPSEYITLAEVKTHLGKHTSTDDTQLEGFIPAAQSMIVARAGQVSPVTAEEDARPPDRHTLVLRHRPVVSVTSVLTLPGGDTVPEADRVAGIEGWYLESLRGLLTHTGGFPGVVRVSYEAGRDPIPGNIRMAALELVAHLWRGSQHNRDRPGIGEADGLLIPGIAYAMPYRVRELLGLGKHDTDMPTVG